MKGIGGGMGGYEVGYEARDMQPDSEMYSWDVGRGRRG